MSGPPDMILNNDLSLGTLQDVGSDSSRASDGAAPSDSSDSVLDAEPVSKFTSILDCPVDECIKDDSSQLVNIVPAGFSALLESYFSLFALCIAINVPSQFLKPDFRELPYNEQWFKGDTVAASPYCLVHRDSGPQFVEKSEVVGNELLETQPQLIPRFQRLIAVANSLDFKRSFVSAKLISSGVDVNVTQALRSFDHLSEVFPQFIMNLHTENDMCLKGPNATSKLFNSRALHRPSVAEPFQPTSLSVLNFSPENYAPTLYEMFNPMLLPEEEDEEEEEDEQVDGNSPGNGGSRTRYAIENAFDFLAPVFTIIFDDMDESTEEVNLSHGVEMPMEFYPQLYTKNALEQVVIPVLQERQELRDTNKAKLNKMTSLQSFQGKQIKSFLNSSINYLDEIQLGDDPTRSKELRDHLQHISDELSTKKRELLVQYTELQKQITQLSFERPSDRIIELARQRGVIDEPYVLRLAALSPYDYLIARNVSNNDKHSSGSNSAESPWLRVVTDFGSTTITQHPLAETEAQDVIKSATRHASETPILFVYIKKDSIEPVSEIRRALAGNQPLADFLQKDFDFLSRLML